ncbi:MAG: TonB-dependent receptor [Deltaproteobacteria bacterium]|nr:MAG: TonB-dependent receptor [Deltaproteobacteria bacterium]
MSPRLVLMVSLPAFLPVPAAHGADEPEELIVEGERRRAADPAEARMAVTTIAVDERLPEGADLADAIARSPGTTVQRLGGLGDFSAVSLRGAALRQVQVHLDGLPLNPDGSAAFNLSELPLRAFERVEIWRGAGPAALAAAPLGGVIDLRTAADARAPLTVEGTFGSWSTGRGAVRGATTIGGTEILGAAEVLTTQSDFRYFDDNGTDGYWLDDRIRRRASNDKRQASGLLRLRSTKGAVRRTGLILLNARDEGLPGPIGAPADGRLRTLWALGSGGLEGAQGQTALSARAWGQLRDERLTLPSGEAIPEQQGHLGLSLGAVRPWARGEVGLTLQGRFDGRARVLEQPGAARLTLTGVGHGTLSLANDRLLLEAVAQGQGWWEQREGVRILRFAPLPRVGARARASDSVTLRTAAGRAVRPPDFLELFGDRGPMRGRSDLRPERGTWADAGLRLHGEGQGAELGLFIHHALDRIVYVQNAQRDLVPINLGESVVGGVELGGDVQRSWFDARASLNLSPSFVVSEVSGLHGRRLPRIPPVGGFVEVALRHKRIARVSYDLAYDGGNAWDEAGLFVAPPRALHGASVRLQPRSGLPAIGITVRNLTDTLVAPMSRDPRNPASGDVLRPLTDFAGYPLPGRTALITLTWSPSSS